MYLSAFLHRDELLEITNRWLSDKLEPGDALKLTKIITYDSFAAWETLLVFIGELLKLLTMLPVHRKSISDKKELKDFICNLNCSKTGRIKALISEYKKLSEFYYIGSPIAGYIYHDPGFRMLGMCRFKRVKRIAEKASRYASQYLFKEVEAAAREISGKQPQNEPSAMQIVLDNLSESEKRVMQRVRKKGIKLPVPAMTIKDILGVKVIDNGFGDQKLESVIADYPGAQIVERETHAGNYNATHYIVELKVDLDYIIERFRNSRQQRAYVAQRGLAVDGIEEDFSEFIVTGADTVQADLIFTSTDELIESEIGRSMHENRIFEQRQRQRYFGNIPVNVEYIIEYLFAVGLSPATHIEEIPIKIWGRYLPDTISYRIRKLYNMSEYSLLGV